MLIKSLLDLTALINKNCSVSYFLEYALSKKDFSFGTDIYMLPNNLNLIHNNKKLVIRFFIMGAWLIA